jgi:hypothetical protein
MYLMRLALREEMDFIVLLVEETQGVVVESMY